jgi:hypothetical protein
LALNPAPRTAFEEKISQAISMVQGPEAASSPVSVPAAAPLEVVPSVHAPEPVALAEQKHHEEPVPEHTFNAESPVPEHIPVELEATEVAPAANGDFDINRLTTEEQELHRRANRVAKVSMQDIKMLRPEQVKLGRENRDICIRLKDDIEKAHREYDRRFKPIMDHPVDYFYRWLVEILAEGDASALGEYPYATAGKSH